VSQRSHWRRFVEWRRRKLHDTYPCAVPTRGCVCPKHRKPVGPVTGICKPCRDELFEQLAAEYTSAARERQKEESTMIDVSKPPIVIPGQMDVYEVLELIEQEESTMTDVHTKPVEAELLPDVLERPAAPGLFGTDEPELVVARAVDVSNALERVIRDRKLYAQINGKEHVLVGGWTLLGSMLGVFPVCVWSRPLEDGWEARVEARTRDGTVVGAAESECLRSERKWAKADDYAVRSMSQTRATSKALRLTLGFVMELAGFDATPADEMPAASEPAPQREPKIPAAVAPTREQRDEIRALVRTLNQIDPDTDWREWCHLTAGVPYVMLTKGAAAMLIRQLREKLTEFDAYDEATT
jgi:hypothetical protein